MTTDFEKPNNSQNYSTILPSVVDNISALSKMDPTGSSFIPDGFVRFKDGWFEEYNSSQLKWNRIPGNFNKASVLPLIRGGDYVVSRSVNDNYYMRLVHEEVFEDTPGFLMQLPAVSELSRYKIFIQARWGSGPIENNGWVGLSFATASNSSWIFDPTHPNSTTIHYDCLSYHGVISGIPIYQDRPIQFMSDRDRSTYIRLSSPAFPIYSVADITFLDNTSVIVSGQSFFAFSNNNPVVNAVNFLIGGHVNFSSPITVMGVHCWPSTSVTGLRGIAKVFKYPEYIQPE